MAVEQYANRPEDTLASSISNSDTSLTLNSGTEFPATGPFRIVIEDEIISVGARSGNVLSSLTRGLEGTSAASHASGKVVACVVTAASLLRLASRIITPTTLASLPAAGNLGNVFVPTDGGHLYVDNETTWQAWGPLFPCTVVPPETGPAATTLSGNGGSITSGATSANVASSSGFPATPFLARIGSEDIKVTNVSGVTWTIVRGYNGTTAASHNDGDAVTLVNWEWVNQGSATFSLANGFGYLTSPTTGAANFRIIKRLVPTAPYRLTLGFVPFHHPSGNNQRGVILRESSSGKLVSWVVNWAAGGPIFEALKWNSPTSANSSYTITPNSAAHLRGPLHFLQIHDDNTNRLFKYSVDGVNFFQVGSSTRTDFITPDEVGFAVNPDSSTGFGAMSIYHYAAA